MSCEGVPVAQPVNIPRLPPLPMPVFDIGWPGNPRFLTMPGSGWPDAQRLREFADQTILHFNRLFGGNGQTFHGTMNYGTSGSRAVSPPGVLSLPTLTVTGSPTWTPVSGTYPIIWNSFDGRPYIWNGSSWIPVAVSSDIVAGITGSGTSGFHARWSSSSALTNSFLSDYSTTAGGTTLFAHNVALPVIVKSLTSGSSYNDLSVADGAAVSFQLTSTGNATVTGLTQRYTANALGELTLLFNTALLGGAPVGGGSVRLTHNDAASTYDYRFLLPGNQNVWLKPGEGMFLYQPAFAASPDGWYCVGRASQHSQFLFDHFADVGNGTTVETDLYSDTLAASQLSTNGQKVSAQYGGILVGHATATRQIKVYFGGTAIFDSTAITVASNCSWTVDVTIIRVSSTVVRYRVEFTSLAYMAPTVGELTGLTLSNTNILKITGQAGAAGAATNDIVAKLGYVEWKPAA